MTGSRLLRGLAAVLAFAACAGAAPARAEDAPTTEVDVSRLTLRLPGDGWTVSDKLPWGLAVDSSSLTVDGERRLVTAGTPGTRSSMVMMVSATRGHGLVTIHAECEPEEGRYVRKFNRGEANYIPLQCLRVSGPYDFPADPAKFGGAFGPAMAGQHAVPPPAGYYVTVEVCNENGAVVEIEALVGFGFSGLGDRRAAAPLPPHVMESVAAWADVLGESALGTLTSLFPKLIVPPVAFKRPPPPPAPVKATPAAA